MDEEIICLDPSCFTSLEKLRDAKHLLNEMRDDNPFLKVYIPTSIYYTILKSPPEKFRELPSLISDWIDEKERKNIRSTNKQILDDYVFVMREFLELHSPKPAKELVGTLTKIGKESVYLDDLRRRFGDVRGQILFEIMAVSSEYKAKIIALRDVTFALLRQIGTEIKRGSSKLKKEWKKRAALRSSLLIAMIFMDTQGMLEFIKHWDIEGFSFNPVFIPAAGLILIANS